MKTNKARVKRAVKPAGKAVSRSRRSATIPKNKPAKTGVKTAAAKGPKKKTTAAPKPRKVAAKKKAAPRRVRRQPAAAVASIDLTAAPQVPLASAPVSATQLRAAVASARRSQTIRPKIPAGAVGLPTTPLKFGAAPSAANLSAEASPVDDGVKQAGETASSPASLSTAVLPPVLFEGDEPSITPQSGPGQKYALGPVATASGPLLERGNLPSSYGTGQLHLVARDPHWLYAHWDLTDQQQRRYNALSADHHLVVRVTPGALRAQSATDIHVHPESRHWFIHVDRAATQYTAELGYYPPDRQWVAVARSSAAATPRDTASVDRSVRFATVRMDRPLSEGAAPRSESTRPARFGKAPPASSAPAPALPPKFEWVSAPRLHSLSVPTLAQVRQRITDASLARYFVKPPQASSAEIPDLIAGAPAMPPALVALTTETVSSPLGGEAPATKSFWLNVNAEVVLYGATEPNATLMIGGYPVALRPDGTFSCRFALPDGQYEVAVWAMSADGDLRQAILKFRRDSTHEGEVGAHPQDPALTAPPAGSQ
jgi:hypothetical protein